MTLPGGFIVWNSSWPPDDRNKMVNDALDGVYQLLGAIRAAQDDTALIGFMKRQPGR